MPALMYHDVVAAGAEDASGFAGRDAALYKVTPQQFEAHVRAIRAALGGALPAPPALPAVTLTFDDGGMSALAAADALERQGMRGHFFVTTNYIGTRGFLDEAGIRELHRRGHVVGSHSCSHPLRMGHCSREQLLQEWTVSRGVISSILGEPVSVASVPGGDYSPRVAETAACAGFTELFTSEPTATTHEVFGIALRGRYIIHRWMSAATAAALARGAWTACARQVAVWNAKKIGKRLAGPAYLQVRKLLLRHGDEVQWGDAR
jgi:peptidoglycan/xylan/chitin deacetylase (PgdA/CDA1 family)